MRCNKKKDICRGVLPSTRRKGAREDLAYAKRRHRSGVRQDLRAIRDAEDWADIEERVDLNRTCDTEIRYIMWDRRDADKLGPLMSWARAQLKGRLTDLEPEDQYYWFKRYLPDSMQGRHALSHVEGLIEDLPWDRWFFLRYPSRTSPVTWDERVAETADKLRELCARGLHAEFNARLKTGRTNVFSKDWRTYREYDYARRDTKSIYYVGGESWPHPLFFGLHAVEDYARAITPRGGGETLPLALLNHLLEAL